MQKNALKFVVSFTAVGLMVLGVARLADAKPQYGGQCSYCHDGEQPAAFTITGETAEVDGVKLFEIERGGQIDFGFDVNNPGDPVYYRFALRGLDRLDGTDEHGTPLYFPRLYTPDPDPDWDAASPAGEQYLYWAGQFYSRDADFMPTSYTYHLEIDPSVAPGVYDLTASIGGGFPVRATGQTPSGGWGYNEDFQLRVIPEPTSVVLLLLGAVALCFGRWWRRWAVPVVLVATAGVLANSAAYAYPSRSGDCTICHSVPGPSDQTGDFEIKSAAGDITDSFSVEAGGATEFLFEYTSLVEDALNPGTTRRAYLAVDGLDLLSVDQGPPADYAAIPYTAPKYVADVGEEPGQWHIAHGLDRYMGPNGQFFAQSSTDPNALMPFPLEVDIDVAPGDYLLTAKQAGGRPSDPDYLNGWTVSKTFTLTVTPASGPGLTAVPEPGTFVLLALALPMFWMCVRRSQRRRG